MPAKKAQPTAAKSKPSAEPPAKRLRKETQSKSPQKAKDKGTEEEETPGERPESQEGQGPERIDHQRMLNTINYQKKKGNTGPWEAYMECSSADDRKLFLKRYMKDKKFGFLTMKEDLTEERGKKTTSTQGWKSKFQIADSEKLPLEHPLLESLLTQLPSRAHSYKPWAEKGEMEYYYESREETQSSQSKTQKIVLAREGAVESKAAKDLEEGFRQSLTASASHPLSLEDGSVKDDPGDMEDEEKKTKRLVKDIKKLSALMTQTQIHAIATVSKLKELCVQKSYLKQLLEALEGELATFNPNRDNVVEVAQTAKEDSTEVNILRLRKTLMAGQAHLDGFRDGALKEAKPLVMTKEKKE